MASTNGQRLSREERRQKMALEEARKLGQAPPEVDRHGNLINPHIPNFMSKAPWYLKQREDDGLKHQQLPESQRPRDPGLDKWYRRGKDALRQPATRARGFKKGACKNCGAQTHAAKDCMERPRKVGAWKTGKNIAADEVSQEHMQLSFAASRDRWNGYDVDDHIKTVKLFNRAEEEKRKQVLRERDAKLQRKRERRRAREARGEAAASESDSDSGSDKDDILGVKQDESSEQVFKVGDKVKATVRNLRIREDTAKYLRNLDPDSAHYDPKTRSMRANPNPELDPSQADYAGDNFEHVTGDAIDMAKTQVFAWEAAKRGETDGHMQANPTQVMLAKKQFEERARKLKELRQKEMHDRYGGEEHVKERLPEALLRGEDTAYVEYSADGRLIKGRQPAPATSRYEEDVLEGNHTKVWGSYFELSTMLWGFGCCWQTARNSYCTGAAGRAAKEQSLRRAQEPSKAPDPAAQSALEPAGTGERKRKQPAGPGPSPEEMEAYHKSKRLSQDPMASVGSDTLLPR